MTMKTSRSLGSAACLAGLVLVLHAAAPVQAQEPSRGSTITLPAPRATGEVSVEQALKSRPSMSLARSSPQKGLSPARINRLPIRLPSRAPAARRFWEGTKGTPEAGTGQSWKFQEAMIPSGLTRNVFVAV
jgi:hypothetical protein